MSLPSVCRCCLSGACSKDMYNEYYNGDRKEVYVDMLLETFNLSLSYLNTSTRLICEECILKLRDATDFKKLVLLSEAALTNKLATGFDIPLKPERHDDEFDFDLITADVTEWTHDDHNQATLEIKQELDMRVKPEKKKRRSTRLPKTRDRLKKRKHVTKMDFAATAKIMLPKSNKENSPTESESITKFKKWKLSPTQLNIKHNSLQLIQNSNLCLFDSLKTKYRCFYCKCVYLKMAELREHSLTHNNLELVQTCLRRLRISCKNVEISNLICKLCQTSSKDLSDLQTHLQSEHRIEFYGTDHCLVPYKILDGFHCIVCDETFNTYYKLSVHMNSHYKNHVCENCGISFINRIALRTHVQSIHKEKKCSKCPEIFLNNYSRTKHMRKEHNSSESKRYCLQCDKTFRYTHQLIEHMVQEHGLKRETVKCTQCPKTFNSAANLRVHVRSVHIRERNYPCQYCGMSFFTSCDQRRHEGTHRDVRSFSCSYCEGRFKSKDSLRRHLKRQHGHTNTDT